jgi:hypothetical protein
LAATGVIEKFLRQARGRYLANLAFYHAAVAVCIGAAGTIALLLLGTQVLDWQWPAALAAAGAVAGIIRARRQVASAYRIAQLVDERLKLQDRVSTVYYFRHGGATAPPGSVETIERQAAERLQAAEMRQAIPFTWPAPAYTAVALLAMCGGLLGIRYGLLKTLDLSRPLAQIEFNPFAGPPEVQASTKKSVIQERLEEQLKQMGLSLDDLPSPEEQGERPQPDNITADPTPEGEPEPGENGQITSEKGKASDSEPSEPGEKGDAAEGDAENSDSPGEPLPQPGKQQTRPQQPKKGKPGESNSSLMDKMRDALANLLNKLKQSPSDQQTQQQSASNQQDGSQQAQGQKGMQSQSKSQDGQPSPSDQGDKDGEGEKVAGNQKSASEKAADRPGSEESKTGMGKQDGNKDIRDAEQLAAMGKISEIFGKRAQQITGEITLEVPSGKQNLKTAYTNTQATHTGAGGEVDRDEIPLSYHAYIQRYFEEVRKLPVKPKQDAAPTAR